MLFKVCLSFHVFNFWELQLVLLQFIFYSILLLLHLWYTFSNFCEDLIYLKSPAFCIASASLKFYLTTRVFIFLPCWRLLLRCWLYYTLIFEWHMHPHTHTHTLTDWLEDLSVVFINWNSWKNFNSHGPSHSIEIILNLASIIVFFWPLLFLSGKFFDLLLSAGIILAGSIPGAQRKRAGQHLHSLYWKRWKC